MATKEIPLSTISLVSEFLAKYETHPKIDSLLMYSDASGEPPEGSKPTKVRQWLMNTNKNPTTAPLKVLGKILEGYMDCIPTNVYKDHEDQYKNDIERIKRNLADNSLSYLSGNIIHKNINIVSKTLEQLIKDLDVEAINLEFDRAINTVDSNPREAVSAASNILESICKVYIEQQQLTMPAKQDLKNLFTPVRKDLNIDPSVITDQDLIRIISGIISIVDGIASLRTHASSAHGAGSKMYNLQPRHARLAIHSSHTIALFILESWKINKK